MTLHWGLRVLTGPEWLSPSAGLYPHGPEAGPGSSTKSARGRGGGARPRKSRKGRWSYFVTSRRETWVPILTPALSRGFWLLRTPSPRERICLSGTTSHHEDTWVHRDPQPLVAMKRAHDRTWV